MVIVNFNLQLSVSDVKLESKLHRKWPKERNEASFIHKIINKLKMGEININIEGYNVNGICVGCLNYNRKMFYTEETKQCFKYLAYIDVRIFLISLFRLIFVE